MKKINTVIIGIAGRMGINNYQLLTKDIGINVVGGVEFEKSPFLGKTMGEVSEIKRLQLSDSNFKITKSLENISDKIDLVVDFSSVNSTLQHLELYIKKNNKNKKTGWVIGTTGFSEKQILELKSYAKNLPMVLSGNFSTGINVLLKIIKSTINMLDSGYDIEIIEHHHNEKIDAPSGTAKMISESILKEKNLSLNSLINGRNGIIGRRKKDTVGMSVLRGGGVVGQHEVHFLGENEKLLLSHVAFNRNAFTGGVLRAVKFINEKTNHNKSGFYDMQDVLNLK